jgi:hypothetical protein
MNGMTMDIGSVAGGYANAAAQGTFCAGSTCTISIIYDQSPMKNDLQPAPTGGGAKRTPDNPAFADALKITISGHEAYGVLINPNDARDPTKGIGYRAGCNGCATAVAKGVATKDGPETIYMVSSQQQLVNGCCFDFGNAETDLHDDGAGTMEALYFGLGVVWGTGVNGGPWVMFDLENGIYPGWQNNNFRNISSNMPLKYDYVTAVAVGDTMAQNGGQGRFALYGGDATRGMLTTMWDGPRPTVTGYNPMQKQGSVILGTGGDNSDGDGGRFYEGVMTSGAATLATLNALQANIVAAKYGQ